MKEWIIENTSVDEERYDNIINPNNKVEENIQPIYSHPIYNIYCFTLKKPSKLRCLFYRIKKDKKFYIYKDVKFRILAETMFDKRNPYTKKLYSIDRMGTCYMKSLDIGPNIKNSKIVIAMCDEPFITPTHKFLHAFVCMVGNDGKEYVLDGTLNIIVEKEVYIKLYNAKIISEIDSEKVKNDISFIRSISKPISAIFVHEYLCFPNEVMEGVKKYIKNK